MIDRLAMLSAVLVLATGARAQVAKLKAVERISGMAQTASTPEQARSLAGAAMDGSQGAVSAPAVLASAGSTATLEKSSTMTPTLKAAAKEPEGIRDVSAGGGSIQWNNVGRAALEVGVAALAVGTIVTAAWAVAASAGVLAGIATGGGLLLIGLAVVAVLAYT